MSTSKVKTHVDKNFIISWHPLYDKPGVGDDYIGYDDLLNDVSRDISQGSISESTFRGIIDWKAPRVKGKIRKNYEYYNEAIKQVLVSQDREKLQILVDLDGIGVPVASTILNFIYPDKFPIMDVRVTEALYEFGYIDVKARSPKNYFKYREEILKIVQESGCPMRMLDRALFAYHKLIIDPEKRKEKSKCGTFHPFQKFRPQC
jgi:hypothetical protein